MNKRETKRVYLDFASQTMPSKKVLNEMKKVQDKNFNPNNLYTEGVESENILSEARNKIASIFGVKSHEIYFAPNSTISCSAAILGTVNFFKSKNKNIKPHIVTSNIEHDAVLENIKFLEKSGEIETTYIACDKNGLINPDEVKKSIKENTILVSIMYANNEVGTIQDIKAISKKIKEFKKSNLEINQKKSENLFSLQTPQAKVDKKDSQIFQKFMKENNFPYFHTDASQAGNYLSLYVDMLGVDMMSLNGSKIYGPKSSSILFKKENIKILPFYYGGGQERDLFSGTTDIQKSVGLAIALEEAQKNSKNEKVLESISVKRNTLLKNILKEIPEVKINGYWNENEWKKEKIGIAREERIAKRLPNNLSIYLPDFPSDEIVLRLNEKGFSVSAGSACSAKDDEYSHVIYALTKSKKVARETIRITIDKNTTEEDLERFVKVLKEIYYKFKNK